MRKRMLRAWRTAGAVFAAYRFFLSNSAIYTTS